MQQRVQVTSHNEDSLIPRHVGSAPNVALLQQQIKRGVITSLKNIPPVTRWIPSYTEQACQCAGEQGNPWMDCPGRAQGKKLHICPHFHEVRSTREREMDFGEGGKMLAGCNHFFIYSPNISWAWVPGTRLRIRNPVLSSERETHIEQLANRVIVIIESPAIMTTALRKKSWVLGTVNYSRFFLCESSWNAQADCNH